MSKSLLLCISFCVFVIGLTGCSYWPNHDHGRGHGPSKVGPGIHLKDSSAVLKTLHQQHREWKGVPYRLGGMSKRGADCSGLVNVIFRNKFGMKLPRTTYQLRKMGTRVSRSRLLPGDLVFFSGYDLRSHVGIYLEKNLFLHASLSSGVKLSRISDRYWHKRYEQARRIR